MKKIKEIWDNYGTGIALCGFGLALVINPDMASAVLGRAVGVVALVLGIWVAWVCIKERDLDLMRILLLIVCIGGGISLIRDPLSMAFGVGRLMGALLLLKGGKDFFASNYGHGKAIAAVTAVLGLVLVLLPMTASRVIFILVGALLIATGATSIIDQHRFMPPSGNGGIIDAE